MCQAYAPVCRAEEEAALTHKLSAEGWNKGGQRAGAGDADNFISTAPLLLNA